MFENLEGPYFAASRDISCREMGLENEEGRGSYLAVKGIIGNFALISLKINLEAFIFR